MLTFNIHTELVWYGRVVDEAQVERRQKKKINSKCVVTGKMEHGHIVLAVRLEIHIKVQNVREATHKAGGQMYVCVGARTAANTQPFVCGYSCENRR